MAANGGLFHLLKRPLTRLRRCRVTLSIEPDSLRLLVVRDGRAVHADMEPLTPATDDGVPALDAAASALRKLLAAADAPGAELVIGLTGQHCLPRLLRLPVMDKALLKQAVPNEMKRDLPVPLDEIYLSWQVLGRDDGHLNIFALGVPRDIVDPHLAILERAGAAARSMDLKPLALIRAVGRPEAIIADLEPRSLDVIIVRSGLPAAIRTVSLRADTDTADTDTMEDKIARLGEELTRAVKFYNDNHPSAPLPADAPAFLTGTGADAATSANIVAASVGHPLAPLEPRLAWPEHRPLAPFMANIGLALKER
ncbi:MAG: hypothetical protein WD379_09205 [Dehalococcoidia bacterium]